MATFYAAKISDQTMNDSRDIDKLLQRAAQLTKSGNLDKATLVANELIRRYRDDPRGWKILSEINFARHRYDDALHCIDTALKLSPQEPSYLLRRGHCLLQLGRLEDATKTAEQAAVSDSDNAALIDGIGAIFSYCNIHDRAQKQFERAVALAPENGNYHFNLATAQRMNGCLAEAKISCDEAIRLRPDDYDAYSLRADLNQITPQHNHVEEMEALLDSGIDQWKGEMTLCFALARELEDTGEYKQSFEYLKRACDLRKSHQKYRVADDTQVIEKIIQTHIKESLFNNQTGYNNDEPIFVLGLPRTGTTLIERIIASHSQVHSAGELNNFAMEMVKAVYQMSNAQQIPRLSMVEKVLDLDFGVLGKAYIDSTRPHTGNTPRFIDKMPQNFLYCGLIKAALPNARIISLKRNPMDSCYAIYKTRFMGIYPWSYDLHDLEQYYLAYHKLMNHWRDKLGESLFEVQYESVVSKPEEQARRIIEFCRLDWEPECLNFHELSSAATTASAVQVRQPIYTSSVEKWRHYEEQLQALTHFFTEQGISF